MYLGGDLIGINSAAVRLSLTDTLGGPIVVWVFVHFGPEEFQSQQFWSD